MKSCLYRRLFLNKDNGTAFIEASVETYSNSRTQRDGISADLKLADCNRIVRLDFDLDSNATAKSRALVVQKAMRLRNTVLEFTDQLLALYKETK